MGIGSFLKKSWNNGKKAVSHTVKAITKGFKHAAHAVGVFTRKALKNPLIRIAVIAALSFFAAPLATSLVAGTGLFAETGLAVTIAQGAVTLGGVQGVIAGIEGKSIGKAVAQGGIIGGATAGIGYGVNKMLTPAASAAKSAAAAQNASGMVASNGNAGVTSAAEGASPASQVWGNIQNGATSAPPALVPRVAGDIANTTAKNAAATQWYNPSGWSDNTAKLVGDVAMGSAKGYFAGAAADKQAQIDQQQIAINQRSEARQAAYDQARSGAGLNLLPQYMTQQATTAQAGQGINQQAPINQRGLLALSLDPNAQYQQGMV